MLPLKRITLILILILASLSVSGIGASVHAQRPVDYVNPFIGASTNTETARAHHGLGKTFPGAAWPFGMVQVSPNTVTGGDNGSGYSYEHTSIEGFAFTQMSGVGWYGDLGNLLITPTVGELRTSAGRADDTASGYRSGYDKRSETASAGYYSVRLTDYDVLAEATVTLHAGALRFTFPESSQSRIQIDLARRVGGTSVYQYAEVVDSRTLRGWMKCTPEGGGWGNGGGNADYTVYFYLRMSRPFDTHGFWNADIPDDWGRRLEDVTSPRYRQRAAEARIVTGTDKWEGRHTGFFAGFDTRKDEVIEVRAGISFVDMEGAENNFLREVDQRPFDRLKADAENEWNMALGKISVAGGTDDQKTVFYTALYHTMIDPRTFADADGRYRGGDGLIHTASGFTKRTVFSGWDVFRSQFPLQTLINPAVAGDMLSSLISLAEESGKGYFERWEFLNAYSGCMVGNPAISVLADAYSKGIRNYDVQNAYRIAVKTSELIGNGEAGYSAGGNSISNTLEYAYSDWCVARLAAELGYGADAAKYTARAEAYRNIFDPGVGWFRPRREDGGWYDWPAEGRLRADFGCIESNPYQQGWFVPHDVEGMVELMGGREKALADLTAFFEKTPADFLWNDYYNHANEPVHHVPFLFNRLGKPSSTQFWTRFICGNAYGNAVAGLVGNEDVGQMSAWYVLAASGIHPLCPGEARYEITSPLFDRIDMKVGPDGKIFTIVARGNSPENVYIRSITLNGKPYPYTWISHGDIVVGGVLEMEMGPEPTGFGAEEI